MTFMKKYNKERTFETVEKPEQKEALFLQQKYDYFIRNATEPHSQSYYS